jgi:hypothetical protein
MSFAVWQGRPPFNFDKNDPEQIYEGLINSATGAPVFVVTDQGQPTQAQVDAVLNPPPVPPKLDNGSAVIASILLKQGTITQAAIDAGLSTAAASAPIADNPGLTPST